MLHVKLLARGNVQGVGFRAFAKMIGASCGVSGYAKNLPDGTVELVAEGQPNQVERFRKRVGARLPVGIRVDSLEALEEKEIPAPSFTSFGIRY